MGLSFSQPFPSLEKFTEGGEIARISYASSAKQGQHGPMTNALSAVPDLADLTSLFGVYRGHGGASVALFCANKFHNELCNHQDYLPAAMQSVFLRMDEPLELSDEWKESLRPCSNEWIQIPRTGVYAPRKGLKSDEDGNICLNFYDERVLLDSIGTSRASTEVGSVKIEMASKGRVYPRFILWVLCIIILFGSGSAQHIDTVPCDHVALAKMAGIQAEKLVKIYYSCGGKYSSAHLLPSLCAGPPPPAEGNGELSPAPMPWFPVVISFLCWIIFGSSGWLVYHFWSRISQHPTVSYFWSRFSQHPTAYHFWRRNIQHQTGNEHPTPYTQMATLNRVSSDENQQPSVTRQEEDDEPKDIMVDETSVESTRRKEKREHKVLRMLPDKK